MQNENGSLVGGCELNSSVLDEKTGKIVKVIFDPVLKCYYEPSRNVYY